MKPKSLIPKRLRDGILEIVQEGVQEWIAGEYIGSKEYNALVEEGMEKRVKKLREEAKEAKMNDKKWVEEWALKLEEEVLEDKRRAYEIESKKERTIYRPKGFMSTK